MLRLPQGITGFNVPNGPSEADLKIFRSDCWGVVAPLHGRVEDRQQVLDSRFTSFITQVLVLPRGDVTVLLNKVHPWLGFCRPLEPGDCQLEFVDPGRLSDLFAKLGRYQVLTRTDLDRPISESDWGELGHAELQQLKYWSGMAGRGRLRVGEVVFNFWD